MADVGNVLVVDVDISGFFASPSHQEDVFQLLLHHPDEIVVEISIDRPNVKGTLMIGSENIRGIFVDVLTSFHSHPNTGYPAAEAASVVRRPISPEFRFSNSASD